VSVSATAAPPRLTAQYEELRAQAVAGSAAVATPLGLAVFLRRGLVAWLAICMQLTPPAARTVRTAEPSRPPAVVPASVHAEAVRVLASMALAAAARRN
jgi:hypothetical protein